MQSAGKKRIISSCIPCYTRKQKCNRRYPCNHCSRRRRPEECAYYPSQALQADHTPLRAHRTENRGNEHEQVAIDYDLQAQDRDNSESATSALSNWNSTRRQSSTLGSSSSSIAELFGYFEYSECNAMVLVRKLGLRSGQDRESQDVTLEASPEVRHQMTRMPDRQICDYLVQYYIDEVHWKEQLVHPPWFLAQYQQLWSLETVSSVFYVEFVVLLMRICSYTSQFLPSPSHPIDRIRGMVLSDIRTLSDEIAEKLAAICAQLDARGSLLRVQHLAFLGLRLQCEGQNVAFWEALGKAALVAQRAGLHRNHTVHMPEMHGLEKEMRRRVFCNLYIWDSMLSRQMDRIPFLPATLDPDNLPRMGIGPNLDDDSAPEAYLERLLQARLACFWQKFPKKRNAEYDTTTAEERYKLFCSEFLATLPAVFALEPSKRWDEQLRHLPVQRQILHIAIFESLCQNYRCLLFCGTAQVRSLPAYKQVLLSSQKKALAVAALKVLDGVSELHTKLGGSHTRFPGIILPTFEAAVLLIGVCEDAEFPASSADGPLHTQQIDPLGSGKPYLDRERCVQATRDALARLRILAEVSTMAEGGANALFRLMSDANFSSSANHAQQMCGPGAERAASPLNSANMYQSRKARSDTSSWPSSVGALLSLDSGPLTDFSFTPSADFTPSWETLAIDLPPSSTIEMLE